MLTRAQYLVLVVLAALALLLVVANGVVFSLNRGVQAEVNSRQQFVQQSVQLEGLYREIVKALAELAVKNGDQQIVQMLAAQGINVSVNSPPTAAAPQPPPAAPTPKR
jgi:hypothetical protein